MAGQSNRALEDDPETGPLTYYHEHVLWVVSEHPARAFDIDRTPHLLFECDVCIRRVRNFPADWRELSPDALYELSWGV